jgi:hypothetical protein
VLPYGLKDVKRLDWVSPMYLLEIGIGLRAATAWLISGDPLYRLLTGERQYRDPAGPCPNVTRSERRQGQIEGQR